MYGVFPPIKIINNSRTSTISANKIYIRRARRYKVAEITYLLALKQEALVISTEILYFCFGLDIKIRTGIKMQRLKLACL